MCQTFESKIENLTRILFLLQFSHVKYKKKKEMIENENIPEK